MYQNQSCGKQELCCAWWFPSHPHIMGFVSGPTVVAYVNHGLKHSFEPVTRLMIYLRPSNLFLVLESIFMDLVFIL